MCGIVGYIGNQNAVDVLVKGLEKLEYRGYDSAGVAIIDHGNLKVSKHKGRLTILENEVKKEGLTGHIGIGHTRWATHGEPSDRNSHPHPNSDESLAIVHNGIIENYMAIKERLQDKGYVFKSETDTEVIAHLIDYYYEENLREAVQKAVADLTGAYAIGVVHKDHPDQLVVVRKDSPLIIGMGHQENFIASDIPAVLKYTRDIYILEDGDLAVVTQNDIKMYDLKGEPIIKKVYHVDWDIAAAEKGGFDHFMIKEIHEQPKAIQDTYSPRITDDEKIVLDDIKITKEDLENIDQIYIVACGTAYYAGLVGKSFIEEFVDVPVIADVGSEFRYNKSFINEKSLMIVVSQSGETADTLAALRLAKERGARVMAITNVVGSTIAREADDLLYTWAGPEIAVASTKAYTTQIVAFGLVALDMGYKKGSIDDATYNEMIKAIKNLPRQTQEVLDYEEEIKKVAELIYDTTHAFYIGRGIDYNIAREGSLKLKEISYIHAEAMAAGELKHGTIALIERGTPVIALATEQALYEKVISNIKEVKARGAFVIAIAREGDTEIEKTADKVIYIPDTANGFSAVLSVMPLQLLAYHVAVMRECDVDKPRNLAKSVTVE